MRRDLPSGTVTLLFTDVEGSTKLLHELGAEDYAERLAEHRRVVREACTAVGGVEVDTQGDAFFVAFASASEAVEAARTITERLASGPITLRIGLHTGTPLLIEEGYVGEDVHFAARVAASAHGGQVVLSAATRALIDERYPVLELGEHRLKDIPQPVAIFQLGDGTFPPLKTISNTNLPRPASSFVGRERELQELLARIKGGARLLTLTGPGGSGKTRLALEASSTLIPEYKAGVFWVGLAPLRDPALVTETIGQTLGAKDGLADHVGERDMLLLLDNLEQVIEAAPEVSALLASCPNLTLLVTSRELLRVQGEVEYPVPPLAEAEAASLFCERAQTEASEEIAELCRRLDNLPLAVELAAARTRALSPTQILQRLSQRLDLLRGGRDADPRQLTLRATIEWSYDLLAVEGQQLLRRLSVFAGGCTLEAAEEVCEANLDTLQSLVEKSLLRYSNERYWMLETIREYALERLEDLGGATSIRRKHAEFFVVFAETEERKLRGPNEQDALARLDAEHDNLREALASAIEGRTADIALRIAGALHPFWYHRGHFREGRRWADSALALEKGADFAVRLKALGAAGELALWEGDCAGARAVLEERLTLARQLDDRGHVASSLTLLGHLAMAEDEPRRAKELYESALELSTEWGGSADIWQSRAVGLLNVGWALLNEGDVDAAATRFEEALEAARRQGSKLVESGALNNLAYVTLKRRQHERTSKLVRESLAILREDKDTRLIMECFELLARASAARGEAHRAAHLAAAAARLGNEVGIAVDEVEAVLPHEEWLAGARAGLGEAAWARAWEEGGAMPLDEAISEALATDAEEAGGAQNGVRF
jgi:predicted ATPase/class 3 adenylate cyclase/Tfp pilus assembly protein PilF